MDRYALAVIACLAAAAALAPTDAVAQAQPTATPRPQPTATPTPPPAPPVGEAAVRSLMAWRPEEARQALEPLQAGQGGTAAFKTAWGLLLAEEGKLPDAVAALAAASTADSRDPASEYLRGEVLYWQRKMSDATAAWQKAHDRARALVAANPDDARARYYLGAALIRLQKYAEGRDALAVALAKGYDRTLVTYQVGLSHAFGRSWQQAKESFDAVLAADPFFAPAYFYRGRVWQELKRTDQMMVDMDKFLRLAPGSPDAAIARSLLKAGGG